MNNVGKIKDRTNVSMVDSSGNARRAECDLNSR